MISFEFLLGLDPVLLHLIQLLLKEGLETLAVSRLPLAAQSLAISYLCDLADSVIFPVHQRWVESICERSVAFLLKI